MKVRNEKMTKVAWMKDVYTQKRTKLIPENEYNIVYEHKYHAFIHFRDADKRWLMMGVYTDGDIKSFFKFCRDLARIVKHNWETVSFRIRTVDGREYERYYI